MRSAILLRPNKYPQIIDYNRGCDKVFQQYEQFPIILELLDLECDQSNLSELVSILKLCVLVLENPPMTIQSDEYNESATKLLINFKSKYLCGEYIYGPCIIFSGNHNMTLDMYHIMMNRTKETS